MIQIAAAMIGYNNAVRTAKNSFAGIVWRQNTFDNEFACPSRADASHVIPCETRPRFAVGYGDFARSHRAAVTPDIRRKCHTPRLHVADKRSEEHTSELQSLIRTSYAVFCLNKKHTNNH